MYVDSSKMEKKGVPIDSVKTRGTIKVTIINYPNAIILFDIYVYTLPFVY